MCARGRLLTVFALALLALPASAQAATVSIDANTLRIVDDPGSDSYFLVTTIDNSSILTNAVYIASVDAYGKQGVSFDIPPECSPYTINNTSVYCSATGIDRIQVDGGDGGDDIRAQNRDGAPIPIDVIGGGGKDRLSINKVCVNCTADGGDDNDKIGMCPCGGTAHGGDGNDQINTRFPYILPATGPLGTTMYGDDGNDRLDGSDFADTVSGDDGNDKVNGGTGADTLLGGDGRDIIGATDHAVFDSVDCGTNTGGGKELDSARIDGRAGFPSDSTVNCEHVSRH